MSSKRHRSSSPTPSSSSSTSPEPTPKASRTAPLPSARLVCTLPPTCARRPTPLASTREMEAHYAKFHAHVCEERGCGCVFPDERLLELHQTECHDPIAAVCKDRGEKIFACHLASCDRSFLTPKSRRLHLIQAHAYPKEYFFAVTNKGIGGLLKKWGEGASLIRGEWKAREPVERDQHDQEDGMGDDGAEEGRDRLQGATEVVMDEAMGSRTPQPGVPSPQSPDASSRTTRPPRPPSSTHTTPGTAPTPDTRAAPHSAAAADDLAAQMSALHLVPSSVRFGRGGQPGGLAPRGRGRGRGGAGRGRAEAGPGGAEKGADAPARGGGESEYRGGAEGGRGRANTSARAIRARVRARGGIRGRGA